MGVGSGDEVILPGYTCVMNVNPIKYLGAKPVYVDIEPVTFNINVDLLQEKITRNTKAVIVQHTYGYPCDMDAVVNIARGNNIPFIEDCCLAFGSRYKGKLCGTFGIAAYWSFQWNKPFTTGLGGMAATNNIKLAEKIQRLCKEELVQPALREKLMLAVQLAVYRLFIYPRTTAFAQTAFRYLTKKGAVVGSSSTCEYNPVMTDDFFKGMSNIQAASGIRQLKRIEKNIEHRKQMASLYDKLLAERGWRPAEYDRIVVDPVMVRYPIRIKQKREALETAAKKGIELGSWFECPLHPVETSLDSYDYKIGVCPEAERASREVVNLPLHPRVSEKTVRRTIEFIMRYTPVV
jgi:perosamine synthetase